MANLTLYGISNCDTVRKARKWLEDNRLEYHFHDFRQDGLDNSLLDRMADQLGWDKLINRRSTSWRQVDQATRDALDENSARQLMQATPTLIKRPVLDIDGQLHQGFDSQHYSDLLL